MWQSLSKWKRDISEKCEVCGITETTQHMFYTCNRINHLWNDVSNILKCNISWKTIVCGFPLYDLTDKITSVNFIVSLVVYTIFKENSYCKFNKRSYNDVNLRLMLKRNLVYYNDILKDSKGNEMLLKTIARLNDKFSE